MGKFALRMPDEVDADLRAFSEANRGAVLNTLIVEAIQQYISLALESEPQMRERFEAARFRSDRSGGRILQVVRESES